MRHRVGQIGELLALGVGGADHIDAALLKIGHAPQMPDDPPSCHPSSASGIWFDQIGRAAGIARQGPDPGASLGRSHAAEADISVVVGTGPWNGLVAHPLFAQTMVPACSPVLLAEKPVRRYEDLNAHTLLVHEARRDDWDRWAANVGLKGLNPAQIVRIDSMSAAMRAAEKKIGIALLPAELSRRKFQSARLARVFDEELVTQEDYTLLVRAEDENRDDIRALCAWLIESCRPSEEN